MRFPTSPRSSADGAQGSRVSPVRAADHRQGRDVIERAVALNPNNTSVLDLSGAAHLHAGDLDEVITSATRALQLCPGAPIRYWFMIYIAAAHNATGRYEEALGFAQRVVELEPDYIYGHIHLAIGHAQLGPIEEARRHVAAVLRIRPDIRIPEATIDGMRDLTRVANWIEGLRKAGLPE